MPCPYKTLGVPSHASTEEIKAAYYKLSRRHHPDAGGTQRSTWQAIQDAYNTLRSDVKRKDYDSSQFDRSQFGPTGRKQTRQTSRRPRRTDAKYDIDAWNQAHFGDNYKEIDRMRMGLHYGYTRRPSTEAPRDTMQRQAAGPSRRAGRGPLSVLLMLGVGVGIIAADNMNSTRRR